jgi:DNA-binding PucR family transcriptional regulator
MQGNVPGMAELLGVHPQTVRYRMRQLESTFAERLQDPKLRFEMELVLRSGVSGAEDEPIRLSVRRAHQRSVDFPAG